MSVRRARTPVLCALAAAGILFACDDAVVQPTADDGPDEREPAAQSVDGPLADIGRGLALALDDASMRRQVLGDMRNSPYPEHSLPLQSYLASDGGRELAAAAARELGISAGELRGRFEDQPALQLFMPSTRQRSTWKGEGPVTVVAASSAEDLGEAGAYTGWTSDGRTVAHGPSEPLGAPTFAVFPAQHEFGGEPTASLKIADGRERATVAEKGALPVVGPDGAVAEGAPEDLRAQAASGAGGFAPGEGGLKDWVSWSSCTVSTNDFDYDGLVDTCEQQLAKAFRPLLVFHPEEQHQSRETYWAVRIQDASERRILIFYALGYHDDHDPTIFGDGHVGDSEFLQLRIVWDNGRWKLRYADYSAHFDATNDHSKSYHHSSLGYVDGHDRGRPMAYVAKGKHAAYNGVDRCEDAFPGFDSCGTGFVEDVEAHWLRNLGSLYGDTQTLENCVSSEAGVAADGHGLTGTECFWTGTSFDGWHGFSEGTTSYAELLEHFEWRPAFGGVAGDPEPGEDCSANNPMLKRPIC